MFVSDSDGGIYLEYDVKQEWLLYYLFAHLEAPPSDDDFEGFEAAHDRAMGRFKDPDALVEHLVTWAVIRPTTPAEQKRQKAVQRRWKRFKEHHQDKTQREILEVISFFLRMPLSNRGAARQVKETV